MGSLGQVGERVFRRSIDLSKCACGTQLVSAPSLMSEMAADLVSKVPYHGDELYDVKCLSMLGLTVEM